MEGKVVEMGLTTTTLLTTENFPALVPNSLFSSQVSLDLFYFLILKVVQLLQYHFFHVKNLQWTYLVVHCRFNQI